MRERIDYTPDWEGAVLGYAVNYLSRHAWRVTPQMDLDDLLQEAYILFAELIERYDYENPRHFMGMWRRCLHNWFVNLAQARTRHREVALRSDVMLSSTCNNGYFLHDFESADDGCLSADEGWAKMASVSQRTARHTASALRRFCMPTAADWEMQKREAPAPLRRLIRVAENRTRKFQRHKRGGVRETTNEYLCRIAGVPRSTPLRTMLERWLRGENNGEFQFDDCEFFI
jgi:DNA-directed RNA polymerase specialized sigma24 family protein